MQDEVNQLANGIEQISLGPDATKQSIRESVWGYLEKNNIAKFPRPVTKRIPNFEGAVQACDLIPGLEAFKNAQTVKVNPDKPQEQARFLVLERWKNLLVPTPRLRHGLFNRILPPRDGGKHILRVCATSQGEKTLVVTPLRRSARRNVLHRMEPPKDASDKDLRLCSRYQGVKEFSVPVGFESKIHVDLVVVGCVAASRNGLRIGKGEGFADLEWAMMSSMGAVNDNTVVVATCHDCQVLDLSEKLFGPHDLTVDFILTPTQMIQCDKRAKPKQIIWSMLTEEKLERIPILKKLRFMERQAGRDTKLEGQTEDLVVQPGEEYVEPEEPEEDEEDEDRRRNRRRYNRQRRPRGRRVEENGEEGEAPAPRPQRRRRGPPRRSEGDEQDGEERAPRKRNPRRRRRRSQGSESRGEEGEDGEAPAAPPRRRNNYRNRRQRRSTNEREEGAAGDDGPQRRSPRRSRSSNSGPPLPAVYVGNLPRGLRVSEFKHKFREQNVNPLRVTWRGQVGYSYLVFESMDQVNMAMKVLSGMSINDRELRVELANRTQQRQQQPQEAGEGDTA